MSQGLSGRAMLAPTIESQKSDIFLRKLCPLLVGACIAGPPTVRGQILGSAGTANAGRASPAPTVKSRNSAYNYTHLSRFIVGVGLCSTRRASPPRITQKKTRKRNRSQVLLLGAPSTGAFKKQCSALFLATEFPRANQHRTVVLVAACGRPPCSRPWCKPKKSPRS